MRGTRGATSSSANSAAPAPDVHRCMPCVRFSLPCRACALFRKSHCKRDTRILNRDTRILNRSIRDLRAALTHSMTRSVTSDGNARLAEGHPKP